MTGDANELVERVGNAIWDMIPSDKEALARAALREIVAAAGGVEALEDAATAILDEWAKETEERTAALLRALAEGGKDA